jgi:hypothetical protein
MHQKLGFTLSRGTPALSLKNYESFLASSSVESTFSAITIEVVHEDGKGRFLISPRSQAKALPRCNIKYRVYAVLALSGAPDSNCVRSIRLNSTNDPNRPVAVIRVEEYRPAVEIARMALRSRSGCEC